MMTKRFTITNAVVIYSGFAATALGRRVVAGGSQDIVGGTSFASMALDGDKQPPPGLEHLRPPPGLEHIPVLRI